MSEIITAGPKKRGSAVLGMFLLGLGIVLLLMDVANVRLTDRFWSFIWPFFIITPGALLLFLGTREGGKMSEAAAVVGGIITMTGLLLFYQNTTNHWESWAYAWALTLPGGVAVGQIVDGVLNNRPERKNAGWKLLTISLIMFAVGAVFFEVVLDISGFFHHSGLGKIALPAILIGLGLLLLTGSLGGRHEIPAAKEEAPVLK
ncbi:MAG: hypothetical protein JXB30_08875 [Anaerolineae bacterium]|nr:hypothetical protein [Anaerolineae bacterium]